MASSSTTRSKSKPKSVKGKEAAASAEPAPLPPTQTDVMVQVEKLAAAIAEQQYQLEALHKLLLAWTTPEWTEEDELNRPYDHFDPMSAEVWERHVRGWMKENKTDKPPSRATCGKMSVLRYTDDDGELHTIRII